MWSLAREEYFYLLYFPLLFLRKKAGLLKTVGLIFLLGLTANFVFSFTSHYLFWGRSAIVLWPQWCLGMVSVEAYFARVTLPRWCYSLQFAGAFFCLTLLCRNRWVVLQPFLVGLAFFVLINFCVAREQQGKWSTAYLTRWLAGVGVFSYSLYLVHNPIRAVVNSLLRPFVNTDNQYVFVAVGVVVGVICYWGGKLFFLVVERRFLNTQAPKAELGIAGEVM